MKKIFHLGIIGALAIIIAGCTSNSASTGVIRDVSPAQFFSAMDTGAFVIDVHVPEQAHIPGTDAFIPYDKISDYASLLPNDKSAPIAVYCRSGHMSDIAAEKLKEMGYTNIINLAGGENAWVSAGMDVDNTMMGHYGIMR